jgi:hypothetical protein
MAWLPAAARQYHLPREFGALDELWRAAVDGGGGGPRL